MTKKLPATLSVSLGLAALLAASCASTPDPTPPSVPVEAGSHKDLSSLVGKWGGDYSSQETGRNGSIVFEFKSSGESNVAHGDVLMWPKGSKDPVTHVPKSGDLTEEQLRTMPQILTISFVSAVNGQIKGTMDVYTDPDCQCDVETTFVGTVQKDTISGTFRTERLDHTHAATNGVWKVSKQQ